MADTVAARRSEDRGRALEAAIAQIERSFGKGSLMRLGSREAGAGVEVISTGSLGLDIALGVGGLPRGRVGNDLQGGRLVEADRKGTAIRFEIRLYRPRSARNDLVQRIWAASQAA